MRMSFTDSPKDCTCDEQAKPKPIRPTLTEDGQLKAHWMRQDRAAKSLIQAIQAKNRKVKHWVCT